MNKIDVTVPSGVRYMSDWAKLENSPFTIPDHPCIINKGLTGCGFTELCINPNYNTENVILCSPRRMLLENKESQHPGEVLYVKNDYESNLENEIGKDLNIPDKTKPTSFNPCPIEYHIALKDQIKNYILQCNIRNYPIKILVTYDSFRIIREALTEFGVLDQFRVVVDEFQSIFTDSKFKSGTEIEFLYHLQGIRKLCYVSATPMMDKYLEQLDEFRVLPFYQMDWATEDPGRVLKPDLKVRAMNDQSLKAVANKIIQTYLRGEFEKEISYRGVVESKELVVYVNSVKNICDIIRKSELRPDQVNILIARTPENQKKLTTGLKRLRLGNYEIGSIPGRGELHKMFTFCTRTVYLGADFYSDNARTLILSDANIECLAVDITLDMPQIVGRQREEDNPWKNRAELYVKLLNPNKKQMEETFRDFVAKKSASTNRMLNTVLKLTVDEGRQDFAMKFLNDIIYSKYKNDYVAVNRHAGSAMLPVFNKLVKLSEERAFEIQQTDYANRFSMFNSVKAQGVSIDNKVDLFIQEFYYTTEFTGRMKLLCDYEFSSIDLEYVFKQIPLDYQKYYTLLGPEVAKSYSYRRNKMDEILQKREARDRFDLIVLDSDIYSVFREGEKYSLVDIKESLEAIYIKHNSPFKPTAKDIKNYFETANVRFNIDSKGKRPVGYKLIRRLR